MDADLRWFLCRFFGECLIIQVPVWLVMLTL